jgi:phosphopantetheinyl transferase
VSVKSTVHLVTFSLLSRDEDGHRYLSEEEINTGTRMRDAARRDAYLCAHTRLRHVLAHALDVSPDTLQFGRDTYGKPRITSPVTAVRFSLSHSGLVGLIAWSGSADVGVDVQEHCQAPILEVAGLAFPSAVYNRILQADGFSRRRLFFREWVRAEAILKLHGRGWSYGLPAKRLASEPIGHRLAPLILDVPVRPGYSAAVAASSRVLAIRRCAST